MELERTFIAIRDLQKEKLRQFPLYVLVIRSNNRLFLKSDSKAFRGVRSLLTVCPVQSDRGRCCYLLVEPVLLTPSSALRLPALTITPRHIPT